MKTENFGFIRVGIGIPHLKVADPVYNAAQISELAWALSAQGVRIAVFPELCVTGYTCGDLFQQKQLLDGAARELRRLLQEAPAGLLMAVGLPLAIDNQLFNCAVILQNGRILGVVPKTYIPNYSEYYEKRWFASASTRWSDEISLGGQVVPFSERLLFREVHSDLCIGVEICEDLWMPIPPSSFQALNGANLILNLSASNDIAGKRQYRRELVAQQSARTVSAYIYACAGTDESTTDVVYGGHSLIAENGMLLEEQSMDTAPLQIVTDVDIEKLMHDRLRQNNWLEKKSPLNYRSVDFSFPERSVSEGTASDGLLRTVDPYPFIPGTIEDRDVRCREIFTIQSTGLSQRLQKIGLRKVVLGISGGLDSTLALLVSCAALQRLGLPPENIIGVSMPGFGTTSRTYGNALKLMTGLGVSVREIAIQKACLQHFADIGQDPALHDVTYENVQARERTQLLMDIANQENAIVVGTGDLSELALGWATYNGDHMSMYAVNVSVPKTLVSYLVRWYAERSGRTEVEGALLDILATPVSPELLPPSADGTIQQKTEEVIGPYELHDFFLYHMVRQGFAPRKILYLAEIAFREKFSASEIRRWLQLFYRRFFTQQFKRSCLPDGPKVGSVALSPRGDWRMPSDASYTLWLQDLEDLNE
ncbi:MAG: NAD(+) synthase [Peptococcaceae bacterium]|jgi:NAD+ synthase (glutamine-hydrolysing)|nr:NAD(+) synthase [Peptococcaceae bacterium]